MNVFLASNWLNFGFALGVAGASLAIAARMTRQTRCAMRLGIFATFVGAAAHVAGGWFKFGEWPLVVLFAGVLIYLLGNQRQPIALPLAEHWPNRIAWTITAVVLVFLAAWWRGE